MSDPAIRTRSGGRAARKASRAETPEVMVRAARPGVPGGQYQPLSDSEIKRIHDTAIEVLEKVGMAGVPEVIAGKAAAKGCHLDDDGRLRYPRALIEDTIAGACREFVLHGRDPKHDIHLTGRSVFYGTGGAAVRTLDFDDKSYRPSTIRDVYDFARLADKMDYISWHSRNVVATDMPDNFTLDVNTAYATACGTSKHIATSFTTGAHVAPILEIFDLIGGGEKSFFNRPFCKAHISPIVSPLRYGEDAVGVACEVIKQPMVIHSVAAPQAGATSPAPLAGSLVQCHAESLAALIMYNLLSPGHPVIFSCWPLVIDLRTGAFAGGCGESALMSSAMAQVAQHCNLICGVPACMTDSKLPDAQSGYEKGMTALATGLSGANLIYECASMFGSLMGASFEGMAIDNELIGQALRCVRGIEVNDDTLSFEVIRSVATGINHFLGENQTLRIMESEYHYPELGDRETIEAWNEQGATDIRDRARQLVAEILRDHYPPIPTDIDDRIRDRFEIILPRDQMRPRL